MSSTDLDLGRLAHKVRELEPGSRALLDLCVRRGLRDVDIARVLGADPDYITRTRTAAMRSVAADLALDDRGQAELEAALAQLPPDAWIPPLPADPVPEGATNGAPSADVGAPEAETVEPDAAEAAEPQAEADAEATQPATEEPEPATEEPEPEPEPEPDKPTRRWRAVAMVAFALLLAGAAATVALVTMGDDGELSDEPPAPAERENRPAQRESPPAERGNPPARRKNPPGRRRKRARGQKLRALPAARRATGRARLEGRRLTLRASGLRRGRRYQVWLYDSEIAARRLGTLRPRKRRTFRGTFRAAGVRRYRYVDVSIEPRDGDGNHSGRSVMRIATRKLR